MSEHSLEEAIFVLGPQLGRESSTSKYKRKYMTKNAISYVLLTIFKEDQLFEIDRNMLAGYSFPLFSDYTDQISELYDPSDYFFCILQIFEKIYLTTYAFLWGYNLTKHT